MMDSKADEKCYALTVAHDTVIDGPWKMRHLSAGSGDGF